MRNALFGLALVLLGACGGRIDDPTPSVGTGPSSPPRPPTDAPARRSAEAIANDVGTPSAIALDGDLVVFTTHATRIGAELVETGGLFVVDKRVPPALMIDVDRRGATFGALATDGASAFVSASDGRLLRVPLSGGDEVLVATIDGPAVALATSGDYVYFTLESGEVGRVSKKGGDPEELAKVEGTIRGLVADDAAAYVVTAAQGAGGVVRVSLVSKEISSIARAPGAPCAVARDGANLYWSTSGGASVKGGSLLRVSTDGANLATVAEGSFAACALAADAASLYFATTAADAMPVRSSGRGAVGLGLMRAPLAGGDPVRIVEATGALAQPGAVAVDATHLYWLTSSAVMRLRK